MAVQRLVRPRDVPLPWATPLVVLGLGLVPAGAGFTLIATTGGGRDDAWGAAAGLLWHATMVAVGATVMDHLANRWPSAGRWALGMGLSGLVPNPAMIAAMLPHIEWEVLAIWGAFMAAFCAAIGAVLGFGRRTVDGLLWKLPLLGMMVVFALPILLVVVVSAVQVVVAGGSPVQWLSLGMLPWEVWASIGILGAAGGTVGLGLAACLHWAIARPRTRGEVGV